MGKSPLRTGKKKKKKKKRGAVKLSSTEIILTYQVNQTRKAIEMTTDERAFLQEFIEKFRIQFEDFKKEQQSKMKISLKQIKDKNKELNQASEEGDQLVDQALHDKWQTEREIQKWIRELKDELKMLNDDILDKRNECDIWIDYRDNVSVRHAEQIRSLEKELQDTILEYEDTLDFLNKVLSQSKAEIAQWTTDSIALQKEMASDKAISHLHKYVRRFLINQQLNEHEAVIQRHQVAYLQREVSRYEKENVELLDEVFDSKSEEFEHIVNFFITQMDTSDPARFSLSIPLSDEFMSRSACSEETKETDDKEAKHVPTICDHEEVFDADEEISSSSSDDQLDYSCARKDVEAFAVKGVKMPIRESANVEEEPDSSEEERKETSRWPVTNKMLRRLVSQANAENRLICKDATKL